MWNVAQFPRLKITDVPTGNEELLRDDQADGALPGPPGTDGDFTAGRPDLLPLTQTARTSGGDGAGLGNCMTIDAGRPASSSTHTMSSSSETSNEVRSARRAASEHRIAGTSGGLWACWRLRRRSYLDARTPPILVCVIGRPFPARG